MHSPGTSTRPQPNPQLTKPANSKNPSSWQTSGPPPSPWHASFPSSPRNDKKKSLKISKLKLLTK